MAEAKKPIEHIQVGSTPSTLPQLRLSPGLLIIPAILYVGLVFVWPLARMFMSSFSQTADPLENFQRILTTPLYTEALLRQFWYSALASVGSLILGYPVAYLMRIASRRLRLLLIVLVVIPFFVALVVRTFGWMIILGRTGPISKVVEALTGEPYRILYSPLAVQIGMVAILLPFMVLPIYSVMASIDMSLVRSAQVMGASPVAAFLTVFLPLTLSGILSGVVLVFMLGIGFFITPDLLGTNSGQVYATLLVRARESFVGSPGFSESMAVILLVATLIALFIGSRLVPLSRVWGSALQTVGPTPASLEELEAKKRGRLRTSVLRTFGDMPEKAESFMVDQLVWPTVRLLGRLPTWLAVIPGLLIAILAILILDAPIIVAIVISFGKDIFLSFPPQELTLQWYQEFLSKRYWLSALMTSLRLGLLSMVLTTILGGLTALGLVRAEYPGKNAVVALLLSPIIIPSVITAIAVYYVFFPIGLVGTTLGLVLGHSLFTLPIVTIIMAANLQNFDIQLEKAARVMGASAIGAFRHVTLPLLRPGIIVAAFFGFLGSFDDLVISLFLVGVRIRTLPIRLWEDLHYKLSPVLAVVSVVEILLVVVVLFVTAYLMRPNQPASVTEANLSTPTET
ncbi:ABC transporter permease subunit [Chloroflexi bacterium TSY]|nr:ABC transporter permease subunit [Chloroflexi bacterium TSY]